MVTHSCQLNFQVKLKQVKIFSCPICDFTETRMGNLKHHFRSKHTGRGYVCKGCDLTETTMSRLKHHVDLNIQGWGSE